MAATSEQIFEHASEAATFIHNTVPEAFQNPKVAIICGSGLGGLQYAINPDSRFELPYAQIPRFAQSSVQGHEGKLVFGKIGQDNKEITIVLLVGRVHYYEGHGMTVVAFATRVCKRLGVETLIVTNAAGALNSDYRVGDIMIINDHLNMPGLVGVNPLRGPNDERFGVRFPPLSDAYSIVLRRRAHASWKALGLDKGSRRLHEGVYMFVGGPNYETRAESRALRLLGADMVGMSTVPEVMTARHTGMTVLAMSLVTNMVVMDPVVRADDPSLEGMSEQELEEFLARGRANHEEVIDEGRQAAETMEKLIQHLVQTLAVDISSK